MPRPRDRQLKGGLAAAVALMVALVWPLSAAAEHCGGKATVTPEHGPMGMEFVFEINLGAPSTLRLFRNGVQTAVIPLQGEGFVSYKFVIGPGGEGEWIARAEVPTHPECFGETTFVVDGDAASPDTGSSVDARPLLLAAGVVVTLVALASASALRRRSRSGGN